MFLTAVRHEVNNLESSVVVQELELAIILLYMVFMEFRKPVQRRNFVLIFFSFVTKM